MGLDLLTAEQYAALDGPPSFGNGVNVYVCDYCGKFLVTIDRTAGTTPFMMPCENPEHLLPPATKLFYGNGKAARSTEPTDPNPVPEHIPRCPPGNNPITARSAAYRVPPLITVRNATVEFYRPPYDVYSRMKPGNVRDSLTRGCLIFKHIDSDESPLMELKDK